MERYILESFYAYDRFYTLYKGLDKESGSPVWIKVLGKSFFYMPNFSLRYDLWAPRLLELNSRYIVNYLDFVKDLKDFIIINEYFEGQPLSQYIKNSLSLNRIKTLFLQILEAFEELHSKNVINGELSPDEIFIDSYGKIKVNNIGFKNLLFSSLSLQSRELFVSGINFFSPEQLTQKYVDHRSDIYSLGALLYYFVEGQKPYHQIINKNEIKQKILNENFPLPTRSEVFNGIIFKATQKNPDNRYQTVLEFMLDLSKLIIKDKILPPVKETQTMDTKNTINTSQEEPPKPVAHEEREPEIHYQRKPKKKGFFRKLVLLILFLLVIYGGWQIISMTYTAKKNEINLAVPSNFNSVFVQKYYNTYKLLGYSDTSAFTMTLARDMSAQNPMYAGLKDIKIKDVSFRQGIFFAAGAKKLSNDELVPALVLFFDDHYEPYFNSDFSGYYQSIGLSPDRILLALSGLNDSITNLEFYNYDLNLVKKTDFSPAKKSIHYDILHTFYLENHFVFLINQHGTTNYAIEIIDTTGNILWTYGFSNVTKNHIKGDNLEINNDSLFIAFIDPDSKNIQIKTFSPNGSSGKTYTLKTTAKDQFITEFKISSNGEFILVLENDKTTKICVFSRKGKIKKQYSLGKKDKCQFQYLVTEENGDLAIFSKVHYKLIDLLSGDKIYFLKITEYDSHGKKLRINAKQLLGDFLKVKKFPKQKSHSNE